MNVDIAIYNNYCWKRIKTINTMKIGVSFYENLKIISLT